MVHAAGDVLLSFNKGDGTFDPAVSIAAGLEINNLVAADLNADGQIDLAFTDSLSLGSSGAVIILLGNGDGTFAAPFPVPLDGERLNVILAGDYNQDGKPDLSVSYKLSAELTTLLNQ